VGGVVVEQGGQGVGLRGFLFSPGGFLGFPFGTVQFPGVFALIHQGLEAAGFFPCFLQAPGGGVANGAADGLPVQLGFKDKALGSGGGDSQGKPGGFSIKQEGLLLVWWATEAADALQGEAFSLHDLAPGRGGYMKQHP